jgi:hypothetical protein
LIKRLAEGRLEEGDVKDETELEQEIPKQDLEANKGNGRVELLELA